MFDIRDTDLLRHPTVEKAYQVMRTFFADDESGDDFAREAIRVGEILSRDAARPDPDVIAAAVLMGGMIVRYDAQSFAPSVSPAAAAYLEKFYDLDPEAPAFETEAERQVLLAHSIKGLEELNRILGGMDAEGEYRDPLTQEYVEFRQIQRVLENNRKGLETIIAADTQEMGLAGRALQLFTQARDTLTAQVKSVQETLAFDKSGLPDHPAVRGVYAWMLEGNLSRHPMGGYVRTNTGIARILVETGATQDPDVVGAALLNQGVLREEAEALTDRFGARLVAFYQATSPFARLGTREEQAEASRNLPEAAWVCAAAVTHFLERHLGHTPESFAGASAYEREQVESLQGRVKKAAQDAALPAGLRARMEKAAAKGARLMAPPDVAARSTAASDAPGAPDA